MRSDLLSLRFLSSAVFFSLGFLILFAQVGEAVDTLSFFQNWFLPGDVVVAGVGLRSSGSNGIATGTITLTGVPCITPAGTLVSADPNNLPCPAGSVQADVVAAFLYWVAEESTSAPSAANGTFDEQAIVGKVLGDPSNRSCFSSGGTSGSGNTSGRVYRADVRNKLPIVNNVRVANGMHTITLPESGGTGNGQVVLTNGATFVVVYRVFMPGNPNPANVSFRAISAYDGAYTLDKFAPPMTQTVGGFYQVADSPASPAYTKLIPIVSNGQSGFVETLTVNGGAPLAPNGGTSTSPLNGSAGARWDNPTFSISLADNAASYSTQVTSGNNQVCLTFAGLWTSTKVKDTDQDGLLNIWETSAANGSNIGMHLNRHLNLNLLSSTTHRWDPRDPSQPTTFGNCTDYPNDPQDSCVILPGANPNRKDIFVEIDSLVAHDHKHYVKYDAINTVGTAFRNAPAPIGPIELHVDVGTNSHYFDAAGSPKDFIIPKAYAQGGEEIDETRPPLMCPSPCTFPNISVLSWKEGFDFVKNGLIIKQNGTLVYTIPTHFKTIRADIFRYGIFAHALATFTLDSGGQPVPTTDLNGNPFPLSYSGVGDRPGSEFMVTLGLWRFQDPSACDPYVDCVDRTGTWQAQAGTLMHELGHLFGLSHAGKDRLPNCKPNYQSVMNYQYQTRLLTGADNKGHVNYSSGLLLQLDELHLSEAPGAVGVLPYRVRFYGPPISPNEPTAAKHCDGSQIGTLAVKLEADDLSTPDWNRNGIQDPGFFAFDVNYDGHGVADSQYSVYGDYNDWGSLLFQQISTSFNLGGTSSQVGGFDAGGFDAGGFDAGGFDAGGFDAGGFDAGGFDAGGFDAGGFDAGGFDAGGFDAGGFDAGELDQNTNQSGGIDATPADQPLTATNKIDRITLNWGVTPGAVIRRFNIYRKGPSDSEIVLINHIDNASGTPPTTFDDVVNDFTNSGTACPASAPFPNTKTCYNTSYDYYITAVDFTLVLPSVDLTGWPGIPKGNGTPSGFSNKVTSSVTHLFVIANDQSAVYGNALPSSLSSTTYGQVQASLSGVTCILASPPPKLNVGSYAITCTTNPFVTATSPTDGVSYNVAYNENGTLHSPGTLTINPRSLTVSATGVNKVYDGTTTATVTLSDNRVAGDILTDSYTSASYADKNVGTGKPVNVSRISISGTDAGNYTLLNTTTTTTADITKAPLTITAQTNTKIYDGNVSAAAVPTVSGLKPGDTVTALAETYDNPNVGTGKTLSVSSYTISDANSGGNYTVTTVPNNTGVIRYNWVLNSFKSSANLGSADPLIWRTSDAQNNFVNSLSSVLKIESVFNGPTPKTGGCVASLSGTSETLYTDRNQATGGSSLRDITINGIQYTQFNWDTTSASTNPIITSAGCYTVKLTLKDRSAAKVIGPIQLK